VAEPELKFRLIGDWHPVLLPQVETRDLIAAYVNGLVGRRDEDANARALLTRELRAVTDSAAQGEVTAMFLMTALTGVPMPVALTVISRSDLRMAPAFGTAPQKVIEILHESFRQLSRPGVEDAVVLSIPEAEVLRLHTTTEVDVEFSEEERAAADPTVLAEVDQLRNRALTAEYWYTVPGTKNVLLVNLSTPMADIPHIMLDFFDSIIKASYFEMPETAAEDESGAEADETD